MSDTDGLDPGSIGQRCPGRLRCNRASPPREAGRKRDATNADRGSIARVAIASFCVLALIAADGCQYFQQIAPERRPTVVGIIAKRDMTQTNDLSPYQLTSWRAARTRSIRERGRGQHTLVSTITDRRSRADTTSSDLTTAALPLRYVDRTAITGLLVDSCC